MKSHRPPLQLFALFLILQFLLLGCSGTDSKVTVGKKGTNSLGIEGIRVTIPPEAVGQKTEIEVVQVPAIPAEMLQDANLVSPVFEFKGPEIPFDKPIQICLTFDPAKVPPGGKIYAAYWRNGCWVQVAGDVQGNEIVVETDHLSLWAVQTFDIEQWKIQNRPTLALFDEVCEKIFGYEKDVWTGAQEDRQLVENNPNFFLGDNYPKVESLQATGNKVAGVVIAGQIFDLVPTNLPKYVARNNYHQTEKQLGVRNASGEWVGDSEIVFKALFTYECRQFLLGLNRSELADNISEAGRILNSMNFWHGSASAIDITQSLLSKVLAHGSTGMPPSPVELADKRLLDALEGVVCRTEMERYARDMNDLSQRLRSANPEQMDYEQISLLYAELLDFYNRQQPILELSRATFPGYEENWFLYTGKKVANDFLGLFLKKEADLFGAKVGDLRYSPGNAVKFARVAALYGTMSDVKEFSEGVALVFHALNLTGDNPLVEYYDGVRYGEEDYVSELQVLVEVGYLAGAKQVLSWVKTYTNEAGIIIDILEASNGEYFILATKILSPSENNVLQLLKLNKKGDLLWQRYYSYYSGNAAQSFAGGMRLTPDGGIIICGDATDGAKHRSTYLVKVDLQGQIEWQQVFSKSFYARDVELSLDNGYLIVGTTIGRFLNTPTDNIIIIKTDSKGKEIWRRSFGARESEGGVRIKRTSDSRFVILSYRELPRNSEYVDAVYLSKIDDDGNSIWHRTFSGVREGYLGILEYFYADIEETTDNGFIIVSTYGQNTKKGSQLFLIKTDSNGIESWHRTFPGLGNAWGHSVKQTTDGGFIAAGIVSQNPCILKTDSKGKESWHRTFPKSSQWGSRIISTQDGGYLIANGQLLIKANSGGIVENP